LRKKRLPIKDGRAEIQFRFFFQSDGNVLRLRNRKLFNSTVDFLWLEIRQIISAMSAASFSISFQLLPSPKLQKAFAKRRNINCVGIESDCALAKDGFHFNRQQKFLRLARSSSGTPTR